MKLRLFVLLALFAVSVWADVKVQPLFNDNMVLQRNSEANFWGTADSGEEVTVEGAWGSSVKAKAGADGKWALKIKTPDAGGPFTLTIKGKNTITFKNVMSGEVWLCTGQSNMDCTMKFFKDTDQAIKDANYPNIRLFKVSKKVSYDKELDTFGGKWEECSPKTVADFSCTGYFFGLSLYKALNIPVGLIHCAWGGTRVEAWTPWELQKGIKRLADDRSRAVKAAPAYDETKAKADYAEAQKEYKAWIDGGKKGKAVQRPRFNKHPLQNQNLPSALYNAMLKPLAPYTVKGAVWYQGESNAGVADQYAQLLSTMIKGWREIWGLGDFPFYAVQLPRYKAVWKSPVEDGAWPILREAFAEVASTVPNAGMAITIDTGEANDIHPGQKNLVGDRLARLALYNDYGKKDIAYCGPVMKSVEFKNDKAVVKFNNGGSPLAIIKGDKIEGFALYDVKKSVFVKADAKIVGDDTVEVTAAGITDPTIVYYAWATNPEGVNLGNKAGIPASPFRFGSKPKVDLLSKLLPDVAKEYKLVYHADPRSNILTDGYTKYKYIDDNSAKITDKFTKVAYFLALTDNKGNTEYVFVEMDPFTDDIKKIGVPVKGINDRFQVMIKNVVVKTNSKSIKAGEFAEGCNIEFWDCNFGPGNTAKIPGASDKAYDFGDQMSTTASPGYGCMQIHNYSEKQSIFCFNNFKSGNAADLGIGNAAGANTDWTFSKNASKSYSYAELKVLVK